MMRNGVLDGLILIIYTAGNHLTMF